MPPDSKHPSPDPGIDRLVKEAKQLKIKADEIIDTMELLNIKMEELKAARLARDKMRESSK
jgi:hypothetical protein